MCFITIAVRYVRGYRKQHEKQAVPLDKMEEFRTSSLSANSASPYVEDDYSDEELQTARRYRSVLTASIRLAIGRAASGHRVNQLLFCYFSRLTRAC